MKRIKCFIAGSKNQERQREILLSVFSNMQTKWNVMFETKSFLNFNGTLSSDGQQKDYNKYISLKADLIIFVFDNNVGDKTIEEFVVAYKSLLLRRHPDILVFCNEAITDDLNIKVMNIMMNQLQQYYIEYADGKDTVKMWIEDGTSITSKVSLVSKYGLAGTSGWRKDMETSNVWTIINTELQKASN